MAIAYVWVFANTGAQRICKGICKGIYNFGYLQTQALNVFAKVFAKVFANLGTCKHRRSTEGVEAKGIGFVQTYLWSS